MPIYKDFNDSQAQILVWKYEETDEFCEENLTNSEDLEKIKNYHPKKKLEFLMIRQMQKMILPTHQILYETIGKPYLYPKDAFISITHSFPYASIAVSKKRIGIDLEKIMDKILKIKHKFINDLEKQWLDKLPNEVEYLTIIWVIKEALYKLHPSKYWSLKKNYEVKEFALDNLSQISCRVFDDDFEDEYTARVMKWDEFYYSIIEEDHQLRYKIKKDSFF